MPNETFAEAMQAHAADAVASVQETPELDYSMESLRIVQRLLEISRAGLDRDNDRLRALATMWGGYLGEVFRVLSAKLRDGAGQRVILEEIALRDPVMPVPDGHIR